MSNESNHADSNVMNQMQKKRALDWIQEKWVQSKNCEICNNPNWTLQDRIVTPIVHTKGLVLGGTIYPQIMLICNNCGNTKYFNAVKMGVLNEEEKAGEIHGE